MNLNNRVWRRLINHWFFHLRIHCPEPDLYHPKKQVWQERLVEHLRQKGTLHAVHDVLPGLGNNPPEHSAQVLSGQQEIQFVIGQLIQVLKKTTGAWPDVQVVGGEGGGGVVTCWQVVGLARVYPVLHLSQATAEAQLAQFVTPQAKQAVPATLGNWLVTGQAA